MSRIEACRDSGRLGVSTSYHGLRRGLTGEYWGFLVHIRVVYGYVELIYTRFRTVVGPTWATPTTYHEKRPLSRFALRAGSRREEKRANEDPRDPGPGTRDALVFHRFSIFYSSFLLVLGSSQSQSTLDLNPQPSYYKHKKHNRQLQ